MMSAFYIYCLNITSDICVSLVQARQGMNQHSNMYSGQVQQHGQSSYYSNTQSPSSAMQQVPTRFRVYKDLKHYDESI